MDERYRDAVVSYGGGVNSTAMVVRLVQEGWRGPVVFADTGCEWPETYCYIAYFGDWLRQYGMEVTVLRGMPWQCNQYSIGLIDVCEQRGVIPIMAMRWCTTEYKLRPMVRYSEGRPQLVGIATEEAQRARDAVYPLLDWGVDRAGCRRIIAEAGLDQPQKSGCYICPFMADAQWFELWRNHPELFERAARLEEGVQRKREGAWKATLDPRGKVTLRDRALRYSIQGMLFDDAGWDEMRAYQPCMCAVT